MKSQIELNISGHGENEGARLAGLVGGWHDDVTILVEVQRNLLVNLIPWHKLSSFLIHKVFCIGCDPKWIHVEADHASDQTHSDCLFPGFLGSAQDYFDCRLWLIRLELQQVLGVLLPSEEIVVLLVLLVEEVAATGGLALDPLSGLRFVAGVLQLSNFDRLAAVNYS